MQRYESIEANQRTTFQASEPEFWVRRQQAMLGPSIACAESAGHEGENDIVTAHTTDNQSRPNLRARKVREWVERQNDVPTGQWPPDSHTGSPSSSE